MATKSALNVDEISTPNDTKSTSAPLVSASFKKSHVNTSKEDPDILSVENYPHSPKRALVVSVGTGAVKDDSTKQKKVAFKPNTISHVRKLIVAGNKGAYMTIDPKYMYYMVEWKGQPYQAECDDTIVIGRNEFPIYKGDWLCRGVWLEKLMGGKNRHIPHWHTMTENRDECVVRLDTVLDAKLNMIEHHDTENPFNSKMSKASIDIAKKRGAYRMMEKDHDRLIKEWHKRDKQEKERRKNKKVSHCACAKNADSLYPHIISIYILSQ